MQKEVWVIGGAMPGTGVGGVVLLCKLARAHAA